MKRSVAIGWGSYLPEKMVTNEELAERVDTSDEWIVERTGINRRHVAAEGELTSDLAVAASERALESAGIEGSDLDLIVLATATPDETFPATATTVQARLGMIGGAAFDVQAVCTGFIYAISVADNFIKAGQAERVLVVGAETFSRILDWEDRATCVLFGDGAGALVLEAQNGNGANTDRGILTTHLRSDGRYHDMLYVDGGPSSTQTAGFLRMRGREVFRHAVTNLAETVGEAVSAAGLELQDIDWVVPHQANKRIIDGTARKLGLTGDKVILTVDRHANTSAASVPLALVDGIEAGKIKPNDIVLLEAMGGGFTWGSCLMRW